MRNTRPRPLLSLMRQAPTPSVTGRKSRSAAFESIPELLGVCVQPRPSIFNYFQRSDSPLVVRLRVECPWPFFFSSFSLLLFLLRENTCIPFFLLLSYSFPSTSARSQGITPFNGIMGPDQRAQLDGFSLFLPFPSRVAVILLAGEPPLLHGVEDTRLILRRILGLGCQCSPSPATQYCTLTPPILKTCSRAWKSSD